jgi:hypothetical protein
MVNNFLQRWPRTNFSCRSCSRARPRAVGPSPPGETAAWQGGRQRCGFA